jgi:phage baseplate assembly protein gpV
VIVPFTIYDSGEGRQYRQKRGGLTNLSPGIVKNNLDLILQGKVLVRIPSLGIDVWARMVASGAGSDRGMMFFPQVDDEVLVAFCSDDPRDTFILGGLWSTKKGPPASLPTDPITKKVFRTGVAESAGMGHEVEFDDVQQKITVKATLGQKIELSPTSIKIEANATTTIELTNLPTPGVTITLGANKISMSATGIDINSAGTLTLKATNIDLNAGNVSIKGVKLSLNS